MTVNTRFPSIPGKYRIFVSALAVWPAVILMIQFPGSAKVFFVLFAAGGVVLILKAHARVFRSSQPRNVAREIFSMGAISLAGLTLITAHLLVMEQQRVNTELITAAEDHLQVSIAVKVQGYVKHTDDGFSEYSRFHGTTSESHFTTPVLVWLKDGVPDINISHGMLVHIVGTVSQNAPADIAAFSVKATEVRLSAEQPAIAVLGSFAEHMRQTLTENSRSIVGAELVPGFATGDTSLVSEQLRQAMLKSSLSHLTAVSGSNTALVITAVITVLAACLVPRKMRIIVAFLALLGFVFLVGPDASVQRAAVMSVVLLASNFGSKRASALASLGFAMMLLMFVNPWQAIQPGFALSVLATAGILITAQPFLNILQTYAHLPRLFATPTAVAIAAQLSVGPILLLLQPGVPVSGIVANIIAAPAAPIGTLFGMLAAAFGPLVPGVAKVMVIFASFASRWVQATAFVIADLQYGRLHWPGGWQGALLLVLCEITIVAAWALQRGHITLRWLPQIESATPWQPRKKVPREILIVSQMCYASSFAVITIFTLLTPVTLQANTPKNWVVVACDVGQGDAVLLRDPQHPDEVMLVDTGDDAEALTQCLQQFQVEQIQLLVLTHDDKDHVGALASVLEMTQQAIVSEVAMNDEDNDRIVTQQLEKANIPFTIGHAGHYGSFVQSNLSWEVLAPTQDEMLIETNDSSLVLRVEIGNHSVLLLADTNKRTQELLLQSQDLSTVDVVKVSHHGSRDHSRELTEHISAQWGLISVGNGNSYGHPSETALKSLKLSQTEVLRTDKHSSIALTEAETGELEPWVQNATDE